MRNDPIRPHFQVGGIRAYSRRRPHAWGDGKTSVLNFLELQQRRKGNIVIRYSPWGLSSADEIWADFGKQLIAGLKKNGVTIGIWPRAFVWIKARPKALVGMLKGAASAAEGAISFSIPKSAVDMTSGLLERHLRISKRDVEALIAGLGDRRAVVFIDDLDPSDPAVIPKLLLALRELLDFSKFVFVLAFDKSVVTKALGLYNKAWGDAGGVFIEKVIDFPFDLPPPSVVQVKTLALRQFSAVCPFVPEAVVESVVSLLPLNPRKLKLFARLISSLKAEAERHDPDELDWPTILIFSLMKLESESLTAEFVRRVCDEQDDFDWLALASGRERTEAQDQKLGEFLDAYKDIPDQGTARIRALITAWQKERAFAAGEQLRYQIYFAVKPHNITWGEFRAFFTAWRANRTGASISEFVAARASAMDIKVATVSAEFIDSVSGHYGTLLETAAATKLADRHAALIAEASDCLDLYKAMVSLGTANVALYRLDVPACWLRMQRICLEWQHFTANPGEPELRQKEVEILSECARAAPDPVRIYEALKPWNTDADPFNARSDQLKKAFISAMRSVVETGAMDSALTLFDVEGGVRRLYSHEEDRGFRYLLTALDSPMFANGPRARLVDSIGRGRENEIVMRNDREYLDLLLLALVDNGTLFASPDARREFIQKYPDLIEPLWNIVVSTPTQFRFLSALREQYQRLIEAGANRDCLDLPDWLAREVPNTN